MSCGMEHGQSKGILCVSIGKSHPIIRHQYDKTGDTITSINVATGLVRSKVTKSEQEGKGVNRLALEPRERSAASR